MFLASLASIIFQSPARQREATHSAILFVGEHFKGLGNQADFKLEVINAISAADIAFILSSSQVIVNWLNALDQSDFFHSESDV